MNPDTLKETIKRHEGLRLKPYRCTSGKLTIGWGHNLDDREIPRIVADDLLYIDIGIAERELFAQWPEYRNLSQARQHALIDMSFHMGIPSLKKFVRFHEALQSGNYEEAGEQILDSLYAKQTPSRAEENRQLIVEG